MTSAKLKLFWSEKLILFPILVQAKKNGKKDCLGDRQKYLEKRFATIKTCVSKRAVMRKLHNYDSFDDIS